MMELRLLPPLVVFEVNVLLGVFALLQSRQEPQNRFFAGFALAASLWCLGSMLYFVLPEGFGELGLRLGFLGSAAVPVIYLYFAWFHAGEKPGRSTRASLIISFVMMNIIANLDRMMELSDGGIKIISSLQVFTVAVYFCTLYATAFLALRRLIPEREGGPDEEASFILYGSAIPFALIGVYSVIVWIFIALPRPNLLLAVMVNAEIMLYYGVRFKKVEVEEVLSKGLLYLIYTVVLTGVIFIGLFLLSTVFDFEVTSYQFVAVIGFCLVSAYAFIASRDKIQGWIDREFFPEKYEYQQMILKYEEELKRARDKLYDAERMAMVGELAAKIAHEIKNPLGPIKGYSQMLAGARAEGSMDDERLDKALSTRRRRTRSTSG
jgi:hypothetical protein